MDRKQLHEELREMTEAATLLPDDRLYTAESYRELVQAIAYAKVVLSKEESNDDVMRGALAGLCEAVDGLVLREEKPKKDLLHRAFPYLMGGALVGGMYLGYRLHGLFGKKENKDETV